MVENVFGTEGNKRNNFARTATQTSCSIYTLLSSIAIINVSGRYKRCGVREAQKKFLESSIKFTEKDCLLLVRIGSRIPVKNFL